jgi:hypothetical protein
MILLAAELQTTQLALWRPRIYRNLALLQCHNKMSIRDQWGPDAVVFSLSSAQVTAIWGVGGILKSSHVLITVKMIMIYGGGAGGRVVVNDDDDDDEGEAGRRVDDDDGAGMKR